MNRKNTACLLAWALAWASVAPAAPAFANEFRAPVGKAFNAARLTPGLSTQIPSLPPASVLPATSLPGAAASQIAQASSLALPKAAPIARGANVGLRQHAAAAQGPGRSILGRVAGAIATNLPWARVFDSSPAGAVGLLPLRKPNLPEGFDLGNSPTTPAPKTVGGVDVEAFSLPGRRLAGGVFDSGPRLLKADPGSMSDVERALRALVDADAAKYGVTSAELATVHVVREGSTIFALFHQYRDVTVGGRAEKVDIDGSRLRFTIKVIKGQPQLLSTTAKLYPSISVQTKTTKTDEQLKQLAEEALKLPQDKGIELVFVSRKIIFHGDAWKAVNLYDVQGMPEAAGVNVAVDIATGEVFAWDGRLGLDQQPEATATGVTQARAEANDHRPDGKPQVVDLALPWLTASIAGKTSSTDADGRWSTTVAGSAEFKAKLEGKWAKITDENRKPLAISASIKPGENVVVANPTATDLMTLNQVNMYIAITRIHDWWKARLATNEARIDKQLPVNVNIDDECNAYYTPGRPSLNFFRESARCSDSGRPGVGAHEYGHFVDDMIGGIVNGGLSEGWGDIGSMFLLGTPIIGEGFIKNRNPSWIRHGENTYQYSDSDEVHAQGQAWMGFAWKLRKALIAKYGEAAGMAKVEAYIIPTLYAKASDIPGQIAQVLLHAMDANGKIVDEAEIRAAAKAHGIDLPANPGVIETLWNDLASAFRGHATVKEAGFIQTTAPLRLGYTRDVSPALHGSLVISGSRRQRDELLRKIGLALQYRSGMHADVKVSVLEGFAGQTMIELRGPADSVAYMTEQIKRLAKN